MATIAQITANQANAQRSTGPRTDAGKAASAQNATTHGLRGKRLVILPGEEEEFATFSAGLRDDFAPNGTHQDFLFQQILHASWNLTRCQKAEAELHAASADPNLDPLVAGTNEAKLKLIALYATRAERSYSRFVNELRRVQTEALYRAERDIDDTFSVLAESKAICKQIAQDHLRMRQAMLAEVRAMCETPMPEPPAPEPPHVAPQAAPQAAPAPAPPPQAGPSDPNPRLSTGFSRDSIFKRNRNRNRNHQQAA
jgi:hypothetical protein